MDFLFGQKLLTQVILKFDHTSASLGGFGGSHSRSFWLRWSGVRPKICISPPPPFFFQLIEYFLFIYLPIPILFPASFWVVRCVIDRTSRFFSHRPTPQILCHRVLRSEMLCYMGFHVCGWGDFFFFLITVQ